MSITIIGAGLSGISTSFHIGHEKCVIFEKNNYPGGHIHSDFIEGFTWDEGPHVSFTKDEYVKKLFENNVDGEFLEYPVKTTNYYKGNWIPHPAQSNLWAIPYELRKKCLEDFLSSRVQNNPKPTNYYEWLDFAFGETFAKNFPTAYTEKYWTTHPVNLTTDWVGERVFYPSILDVQQGFLIPLPNQTHYITTVRYPKMGGYFSFAKRFYKAANVNYNHELKYIDFNTKAIIFKNGLTHKYERLISTIPLPTLIENSTAPNHVKIAASSLTCTELLIINVSVNHNTLKSENWIYVYDVEKFSTRINCTELLSPYNAPTGKSGIQVEVYFSKYRIQKLSDNEIADKVIEELIELGLIKGREDVLKYHTKKIKWANVLFDHKRKKSLKIIFDYLQNFGLTREMDEYDSSTNWNQKRLEELGSIILAGRFGQWKYYWTDDCVLRGKLIGDFLK